VHNKRVTNGGTFLTNSIVTNDYFCTTPWHHPALETLSPGATAGGHAWSQTTGGYDPEQHQRRTGPEPATMRRTIKTTS